MVADLKLVPNNDTIACGLLHHSQGKKATLTLLLIENKSHLLFPKLQFLSTPLLGKQWEIETFHRKLLTSSVSPG